MKADDKASPYMDFHTAIEKLWIQKLHNLSQASSFWKQLQITALEIYPNICCNVPEYWMFHVIFDTWDICFFKCIEVEWQTPKMTYIYVSTLYQEKEHMQD